MENSIMELRKIKKGSAAHRRMKPMEKMLVAMLWVQKTERRIRLTIHSVMEFSDFSEAGQAQILQALCDLLEDRLR